MTDCIFEKIEKNYPELLRARDLVSIGLYSDPCVAFVARKNCTGPEYFRIGGRILYPKEGVIKFLQEKLVNTTNKEK